MTRTDDPQVTKAMVEAGVKELREHHYGYDLAYAVDQVFRAMWYAGEAPEMLSALTFIVSQASDPANASHTLGDWIHGAGMEMARAAIAKASLIAAAPDLAASIMNSDSAHWTPAMRAALTKAGFTHLLPLRQGFTP